MYNADGEFLFKFGSHGEGNGQFNAPTGVAVDSNGNIIVADWGNSRIQVRLHPHYSILKRDETLLSPSVTKIDEFDVFRVMLQANLRHLLVTDAKCRF